MAQSTITTKFQTTVPKEIRQKLGLRPQDKLHWEIVGNEARIVPARRTFLAHRGRIQVGPGSAVGDVARARTLRGTDPS
ncbi:MAG: type II toxin-antitoxin system PrlF family antitoxin [Acidobacteriota bacterium]